MSLFRKNFPTTQPQPKIEPVKPKAAQPVAPPPPPPGFLRDNDIRTSLGPDAVISGRLSFTTPTRIEGKLKGELRCTQLLIIGPTAVVEGSVKADELRLDGIIRGEIVETRKVEIGRTGRLQGRVQTQVLVMHDGAFFDGEMRMGLDEEGGRKTGRAS